MARDVWITFDGEKPLQLRTTITGRDALPVGRMFCGRLLDYQGRRIEDRSDWLELEVVEVIRSIFGPKYPVYRVKVLGRTGVKQGVLGV